MTDSPDTPTALAERFGHMCDVAECEAVFATMAEVVAHERSHRVRFTPTVPDELVQAVHDVVTGVAWGDQSPEEILTVLRSVPDGWAEVDGEWVQVTKGPMSSHGQLLLVRRD